MILIDMQKIIIKIIQYVDFMLNHIGMTFVVNKSKAIPVTGHGGL
jgi:hypothetical protein